VRKEYPGPREPFGPTLAAEHLEQDEEALGVAYGNTGNLY